MNLRTISVVVPCKNEERYLARCLDSLLIQTMDGHNVDVIVVDNGSTDGTAEVLRRYASQVTALSMPDINISEVRNAGAAHSRGEWIAFVDADVEVDQHWCTCIAHAIGQAAAAGYDISRIVTGSTCGIPSSPSWVEKAWFGQLLERDAHSNRYINGGNLIVHRRLFEAVGGFDQRCLTGEDEQFCIVARLHRGIVLKDNSIKAIHHGYPKTVLDFFRRERWHGLGSRQILTTPWKSKELCLALYILAVLLIFPVPLLIYRGLIWSCALTATLVLTPLAALSTIRCNWQLDAIPKLTCLYFIYGCAKVVALFDTLRSSNQMIRRFKDQQISN